MITLPLPVKARFVILGIVSFDKNPCLKFELMGCEDEPEENRHLGEYFYWIYVFFDLIQLFNLVKVTFFNLFLNLVVQTRKKGALYRH